MLDKEKIEVRIKLRYHTEIVLLLTILKNTSEARQFKY